MRSSKGNNEKEQIGRKVKVTISANEPLYKNRQAATDLEDWLEAERLVKTELLAEGQWAETA